MDSAVGQIDKIGGFGDMLELVRTIDPNVVAFQRLGLRDIDHPGDVFGITVTVRASLDEPATVAAAVKETILFWYRAGQLVKAGVFEETKQRYFARAVALAPPAHSKAVVTVFGDVPTPGGVVALTMTEAAIVQEALDAAYATTAGWRAAVDTLAQVTKVDVLVQAINNGLKPDAAQIPPAATEPAPDAVTPPTPAAPPAPPSAEGVVAATKAPRKGVVQYADGQLVQYAINKIEMGTQNGSVVYKLWGPLGRQYPLHTIYQTNASGQPTPNWEVVGPALTALGLDLNKLVANGDWRYVARADHAGPLDAIKEYMNAVSLTPA